MRGRGTFGDDEAYSCQDPPVLAGKIAENCSVELHFEDAAFG